MPSWYTVVQYLPRPVAEERVNLGIIAWGGGEVVCAFVDDFARARAFGGGDVSCVAEAVGELKRAVGEGRLGEAVERMAREWGGIVQLTPPRASLLGPRELLGVLRPLFLA
ncbi:MAG: DUF3037 domain-containing protein [Bacillota bacterium]